MTEVELVRADAGLPAAVRLRRALGAELRFARTSAGLTLEGAVERFWLVSGVRVGVSSLSHWENGNRAVDLARLVQLCEGYHLDPCAVLEIAMRQAGVPGRHARYEPARIVRR